MQQTAGPLTGIRVLDFSQDLAGPLAAQFLGDFGAEVIKIEPPQGDRSRGTGPSLADAKGRPTAESAAYLAANRNKASIVLDLGSAEGLGLARSMIAGADVVVHGFTAAEAAEAGLDAQALERDHPELIVCSVTAYGAAGPYAGRRADDAVIQAQSGLMSVTGNGDDVPGGGPMQIGAPVAAAVTGVNAAISVMLALLGRQKDGQGQAIDIAMLDVAITMQSHVVQNYLMTGDQPIRRGNSGNGGHPAQVFSCKDGDVYISAGTDQHYAKLCKLLGHPEMIADPRFDTLLQRDRNRAEIDAVFGPILMTHAGEELVEMLVEADIPCSLVNSYADVFANAHVQARGQRVEAAHALGPVHLVSNPVRLSEAPTQYRAPPVLGSDTEAVLASILGLDPAAIADLKQKGVVV